jgi:hypothetical protein
MNIAFKLWSGLNQCLGGSRWSICYSDANVEIQIGEQVCHDEEGGRTSRGRWHNLLMLNISNSTNKIYTIKNARN